MAESPPLEAPPLEPLARRWTLGAAAGCLLPLLLQVPPTLALGIGAVALAVPLLARDGRAPGWLRLLLIVGLLGTVMTLYGFRFGRDTGCALLATMLALKPVEMRTLRDARSLLGFALFAPFATFLLDQGPRSLVLGLLAAIAVLTALHKLSEIEVGDVAPAGRAWRRPLAVMRMIGIGLPLAMGVFWLFPRFSSPLWGVPERALTRPGLSDRMSPGDWIDIIADDSPALRATFFGDAPPPSQMYWRGPVLWDFDGRTWTAVEWAWSIGGTRPAPGPKRYDYELEIEPTDRNELVALELPLGPPPGARLHRDYSLRSAQALTGVTRWRMASSPRTDADIALHPALRRLALRLPPDYNPRTLALSQRWRREAGASGRTSDTAIVKRALDWIRADFVYTLDTPLLGRHSVDEFLFDRQAGFCEHFSASFVVLMRGAGIPARVVTGYVGGYRNPVGDYWLVRRSDAHAWAEVWLDGRGWVRVDPTAAVAPERIYDTIADRRPGALGGFAGLAPVFDVGDWMRRGWNDFVLGYNANRQRRLLENFGIPDLDSTTLIQMFVIATVLALAGMLWLTTRQERERDPVLRAWRRLERRYRRLGLGRAPHEPAGAWAERVAAARPDAQDLRELSARFVDWRYARDHGGIAGAEGLIRDLRGHRP
ncbi:MAG: transglutaminaseTgpA domain-containing protein [Pseudomonadota bacterium]